ncbi:Uncharacterized protein Rs2_03156 [Raphanus sativus]|nr:Uncharacterized protein Rs2_03156 [Raphanus sativus]
MADSSAMMPVEMVQIFAMGMTNLCDEVNELISAPVTFPPISLLQYPSQPFAYPSTHPVWDWKKKKRSNHGNETLKIEALIDHSFFSRRSRPLAAIQGHCLTSTARSSRVLTTVPLSVKLSTLLLKLLSLPSLIVALLTLSPPRSWFVLEFACF